MLSIWLCVRRVVLLLFIGWLAVAQASELRNLGPDGGDARRLAFAPGNPDRVFLGTSSGRLYVSNDGGANWSPLAHLGDGFDYVLDNIAVDPRHTDTLYVSAWSTSSNTGELFRSRDGGRSWTSLPGMHGKSIRSLAMAPSNSKVLVAGTLEGVFRSLDKGESWSQISPANHPDIRNIQSLAIDPRNPDVIYAGTWHLAWKTSDGGRSWKQINRGMTDSCEVSSIVVDPAEPTTVYASACSGIYKSQSAGELFARMQAMPPAAGRARVLKQDPNQAEVVYAGTSEGLWRTADGGRRWQHLSAPNLIVNDILVDPRNSEHVLLATDRNGVLASSDGARSFAPSNLGFSHREVASVMVDQHSPETVYAGVAHDKEFGGVFASRDSGAHWSQMSLGLGGEDVLTLGQDSAGQLYAGTSRGLFRYFSDKKFWVRIYPLRRSQSFEVAALDMSGDNWVLVGPQGIAHSGNHGRTWTQQSVAGEHEFLSVHACGAMIVAATHDMLLASRDGGRKWDSLELPAVSRIHSMAVDNNEQIWLASPQGVFYRDEVGNWEKATGVPEGSSALVWDGPGRRMLVVTNSNTILESSDGERWQPLAALSSPVRALVPAPQRLLVGTEYDGMVALERHDNGGVSARLGRSSKGN